MDLPLPGGPGVGSVLGNSHTTIGPFMPGTPQWMCAMNALLMFEAISLYSTVVPSADTVKFAWPWA